MTSISKVESSRLMTERAPWSGFHKLREALIAKKFKSHDNVPVQWIQDYTLDNICTHANNCADDNPSLAR